MLKRMTGGLVALLMTLSVLGGLVACTPDSPGLDDDHDWNEESETLPQTDPDTTATSPAETDPAETDPAETDPAETDPAETQPHVHTFSDDWAHDDTHHWHAATCDHTTEIQGKGTHTWDAGVLAEDGTDANGGVRTYRYTCTVCRKTRNETVPEDPRIAELVDFVVHVESGREIRILQITDIQVIDPGQVRYPERLKWGGVYHTDPLSDAEWERYYLHFSREAIRQYDPDLILVTGDNVYGQFDDRGTSLLRLIAFFEEMGIPWAPVNGNHDNESEKGVDWQNAQYEAAEHCLYKKGSVTGNGNYSIGIVQDGKLVKTVYMMDSHGVLNSVGFKDDQLGWLNTSVSAVDATLEYPVSKFLSCHIATYEYFTAAVNAGYQTADGDRYQIGSTVPAQNGDFGTKGESNRVQPQSATLWNILKGGRFDGVFVGHTHMNNTSVYYDGIRFTYGLKSSYNVFDAYNEGELGATRITLGEGGRNFTVSHLYVDKLPGEDYFPRVNNIPWVVEVSAPHSTGGSTTIGGLDAYYYFNGTGTPTSPDYSMFRLLKLDSTKLTAAQLSSSRVSFLFDVYIPEDYQFEMNPGHGNRFMLYARAPDAAATYYEFYASGLIPGQWNTCVAHLDQASDYRRLNDPATVFGFLTPSQSTFYWRNIRVVTGETELATLNPWLHSLGKIGAVDGSRKSVVTTATVAGESCIKYVNNAGTVGSPSLWLDRNLNLNVNMIPADVLTKSQVTLSFDVYLDEDYTHELNEGQDNVFGIRLKVGSNATFFRDVTADQVTLGQWSTVKIVISDAAAYQQLHNGGQLSITTPSGSTLYLKNFAVTGQ
mgnify:CR=1 FL=1